MATDVERYWDQFLTFLPTRTRRPSRYAGTAAFGFKSDDAREIAPLVRNGTKTASGGSFGRTSSMGSPGRPGS